MKIYKDKTFIGIGFLVTKDVFVIRLRRVLIEIYNKSKFKYTV